MVLVSRERQCLGGSALSMTVIPSDNKAEHINITIAKTHNITNWPIQWVIGQFDEIGQLGAHYMRIGQFDVNMLQVAFIITQTASLTSHRFH